MKLRTTLLLLLLVIGAAAFFLLYTAKQPGDREYKEQKERVFPSREFDDPNSLERRGLSDVVTRVELKDGQRRILIERATVDSDWDIMEPIRTAADSGEVASVLSELEFLKSTAVLREEEGKKLDLGAYELDKPARSVTFNAGEKSWTLNIGAKTADGKSAYVARQDDEEPTAYVVPESILGKAGKTVTDLRDKSAIRFDKDKVTRVTLEPADKPAVVCRKGKGAWQLVRPVADEADAEAVEKLLEAIRKLDINKDDFITEDDRDLAKFGLDKPGLKVSVFEGDTGRTLLVGSPLKHDEHKLHAKRGGEPAIFALSKTDLNKLKKTPGDLRSRKGLQFEAGDVVGVEVRLPDRSVKLTKKDDEWTLEEPSGFSADSTRVKNFLDDLHDLPVEDWMDAPSDETLAGAGLDRPRATVVLTFDDAKEMPPSEIRFGKTDKEGTRCHARRGDKGSILLVPSAFPDKAAAGHLAFLPRKVLEFNRGDVAAVRIERSDRTFVINREKEDDKWTLVEPIRGEADADAMDDLLWTLSYLEAKRLVAEKPKDLAPYGLDAPRARAVISLKPEKKEGEEGAAQAPKREQKVLLIGSKTEDDLAYGVVEGGDYLFLVGQSTVDDLMAEFASRTVLEFEKDDVLAVEIAPEDPSKRVRYAKSDDQWRMTRPSEQDVEKDVVEDILDNAKGLRAESIASYDKAKTGLKRFGLDKPHVTLLIELKDGAQRTVSIGKKEGEERYVISSAAPSVFRVKNDELSAILEVVAPAAPEEGEAE